jgi:omega-6 fatty acid desaturase (delta-12 desaturase)
LKAEKRALIDTHARPDDLKASIQILNTLVPLAALWVVVSAFSASLLVTGLLTMVMTLLLTRVFALMHDAGHGSLYRGKRQNQIAGFFLGVICGMPQYVWSQHHAFHHATNGNWAKYRGPFSVITVSEYGKLSENQQRRYRRARHIFVLPIAGFTYLLFNPRYTWLKGSLLLVVHLLRGASRADFKTPYWATPLEYRHMSANNIVLLSVWAAMSWAIGPALFFTVYVISLSLAAAIGIILFTVQHNFEGSYASADEGWDYDNAVIEGTSFLVLPRWLNWVTADIAYHHVHHISATIPNYRLAAAHAHYEHLFGSVRRLRPGDVLTSLKCILWDEQGRRIVSVAALEAAARPA